MRRMIVLTVLSTACAFASLQIQVDNTGAPVLSPETGTGFGGLVNVLTVQESPFETGCTAWNGTTTITGSTACPSATYAGGNEAGTIPNHNFSPTFGYLGITDLANLKIFFNADQTGVDHQILLDNLTLTIYNSVGTAVGTFNLLASQTPFLFNNIDPEQGVGKRGWLIEVTAAESAPFMAANPNISTYHIGLAANIGADSKNVVGYSNDGPDTFTVQAAPGNPVPDPASIFTLGSALIVAGGYARRRFLRR